MFKCVIAFDMVGVMRYGPTTTEKFGAANKRGSLYVVGKYSKFLIPCLKGRGPQPYDRLAVSCFVEK
jgi:hypothetical protein